MSSSTPFRLLVPSEIVRAMFAQAEAELPNECCGLLAGILGTNLVQQRYPLVNVAQGGEVEFLSDPRGMFDAVRDMRKRGIDVLAVYHSHPTSEAIPSKKDRDRNYSPDVVNLIISLKDGTPQMRLVPNGRHRNRNPMGRDVNPRRAAGFTPAVRPMMPYVIFIFGSGLAFFVGVGLILWAILLTTLTRWRILPRLAPVTAIVGVMLVTVSAAPLPYWLYALAATITLIWIMAENWSKKLPRKVILLTRMTIVVVWVAALAMELPYHVMKPLPSNPAPALWIIGDSITAGVGDKSVIWPKILVKNHNITVHDYAGVGATVKSALRGLQHLPLGDGIVLLQIGGNDLLGDTTTADFEVGLDQLLAKVCKPGRTILMLELPLPPFRNDYGIVQRRLAEQFGVLLIPKRLFIDVLTTSGATLDNIHLTQSGQDLMAELVWRIVGPGFGG